MEDKFFNTTIYNEESRQKAQNLVDDYMEYQEGMEILDSTLLLPGDTSRGKPSSMPQPKTRPDSPVPSLQRPCDRSLKSEKP